MKKIRTILVDDDPQSLKATETLIRNFFPDVELIGMCDNSIQAIKMVKQEQPDLLVADIEMPDISGIELIRLLPDHHNTQVVFLTGFAEYALDAIKVGASDYLLKPVSPQSFRDMLEKLEHKQAINWEANLETPFKNRLLLNQKDRTVFLDLDRINRLIAAGQYTNIYLDKNERIVSSKPLKYFETVLSSRGFVRPHRTHMFNIHNIREITKDTEGSGTVHFKEGDSFQVSQDCKDELIKMVSLIQGKLQTEN